MRIGRVASATEPPNWGRGVSDVEELREKG